MSKKKLLVTGCLGQSGSYLSEYGVNTGHKVYGVSTRRSTNADSYGFLEHLKNDENFTLIRGDITDPVFITNIISEIKPDKMANMAAMSHVGQSFSNPTATFETNATAVVNMLSAIKTHSPHTRFYQASSVSFDTPVMIEIDGLIRRTSFEDAFKTYHTKSWKAFRVLTADNNGKVCFKNVLDVIDHGEKECFDIYTSKGIAISITGDHSIIQIDGDKYIEKKVTNMSDNDMLLTFCSDEPIKSGDSYMDYSFCYEYYNNIPSRWGYENQKSYKREYLNFSVNPEFAYLLGMYVAEGSSCSTHENKSENKSNSTRGRRGGKITWTFGKCDFDKHRPMEVEYLVRKIFDKKVSIYDRDTSINISVSSMAIVSLFDSLCLKGAWNKKIPEIIFNSPNDVKMAFLNGYLGDAKIDFTGITYTTVSENLATDTVYLLRLLGIGCKLVRRFNKSHLSPQNTMIRDSYCFDVKVPNYYSWLKPRTISKPGWAQRTPDCEVLNKSFFKDMPGAKLEKNPSRKTLRDLNNKWGFSDLGVEKIKEIVPSGIKRVGDFSVEDTEKWFCGLVPILVHNTSEMFGGINCPTTGYTEKSELYPRSPYGVSKLAAHWAVINFREAYGLKCSASYLFNHESERRGLDFISRKVTNAVARIKAGLDNKIVIGNIDAFRDWGYAKDYMKMVALMLDSDTPEEFVIATGKTHSVKELLETAFNIACLGDWQKYTEFDEALMRPSEVPYLLGDASKAREKLGWVPETSFEQLIELMLVADLKRYGM